MCCIPGYAIAASKVTIAYDGSKLEEVFSFIFEIGDHKGHPPNLFVWDRIIPAVPENYQPKDRDEGVKQI